MEEEIPKFSSLGHLRVTGAMTSQDKQGVLVRTEGHMGKKGRGYGCWVWLGGNEETPRTVEEPEKTEGPRNRPMYSPCGERLGGSQPLGSWSPDFRGRGLGAVTPGQVGWLVWSPKSPGWWQGPASLRAAGSKASVTRLLLRILGTLLQPGPPVLAGNGPSKTGFSK